MRRKHKKRAFCEYQYSQENTQPYREISGEVPICPISSCWAASRLSCESASSPSPPNKSSVGSHTVNRMCAEPGFAAGRVPAAVVRNCAQWGRFDIKPIIGYVVRLTVALA